MRFQIKVLVILSLSVVLTACGDTAKIPEELQRSGRRPRCRRRIRRSFPPSISRRRKVGRRAEAPRHATLR